VAVLSLSHEKSSFRSSLLCRVPYVFQSQMPKEDLLIIAASDKSPWLKKL
jgi:hypothetical protein